MICNVLNLPLIRKTVNTFFVENQLDNDFFSKQSRHNNNITILTNYDVMPS